MIEMRLIFEHFHLAPKTLGKSTECRLEREVIHGTYVRKGKGLVTGWPQTVPLFPHQPLKWNSYMGFRAGQKCHRSKRDAQATFVEFAHFLASRNDCIDDFVPQSSLCFAYNY